MLTLWTDYETRLLPKYAANGRTMAWVAQEFGRTRRAVNFKASQLGVSFHGVRGRKRTDRPVKKSGRPGAPLGNKNASGVRRHRQWRFW